MRCTRLGGDLFPALISRVLGVTLAAALDNAQATSGESHGQQAVKFR